MDSYIRNYILDEIESWWHLIRKKYAPESFHGFKLQDLQFLINYFLNNDEEKEIPYKIDDLNKLLKILITGLRCPAGAVPFHESSSPLARIDNYFDSFPTDNQSHLGTLFSILHETLFGYLASDKRKSAVIANLNIAGIGFGYLTYFEDSDSIDLTVAQRSLLSQDVAEDVHELYREIKQSEQLNGNAIIYLYSSRTNSYYLSSRDSLPARPLQLKEFPFLRKRILEAFCAKETVSPVSEYKLFSIQNEHISKQEEELINIASNTSRRIWDTQKYYATKFIRDRLQELPDGQNYEQIYNIIFDFIPSFLNVTAAFLWKKKTELSSQGKWQLNEAMLFMQKKGDSRECMLNTVNEHDPLCKKYENNLIEFTELSFIGGDVSFCDVTEQIRTQLANTLDYKNSLWTGSSLDFRSRLTLPIQIMEDGHRAAVIELFFSCSKQELAPVIYDIIRMLYRMLIIARHEFDTNLELQKKIESETRAKSLADEYANQAHEVKKMIGFIDGSTPPKILINISNYFRTLFAIDKREAERLANGDISGFPAGFANIFDTDISIKDFILQAAEIAASLEASIDVIISKGKEYFKKVDSDTVAGLVEKKSHSTLKRFAFSATDEPLLDKIFPDDFEVLQRWFLCAALVCCIRNILQHSKRPNDSKILILLSEDRSMLVVENLKKLKASDNGEMILQEKTEKFWPGSTGDALRFYSQKYGSSVHVSKFLEPVSFSEERQKILKYRSYIPLPDKLIKNQT